MIEWVRTRLSLINAAHLLSHWSFFLLLHNYDQPSIHWQHCNRMPHNTFIVGCVLRRPPLLCFMPILNSRGQLGHYKCALRLRPLAFLQLACRNQTDLLMKSLVFLYLTHPSISYENWAHQHCTVLNHTADIFLYRSAQSRQATVYQTPICHAALKRRTNPELRRVPGATLREDNSVLTLKRIYIRSECFLNRTILGVLELDLWQWGDGKTYVW